MLACLPCLTGIGICASHEREKSARRSHDDQCGHPGPSARRAGVSQRSTHSRWSLCSPINLLVEVEAAGVNFFDTQLRSGLYKRSRCRLRSGQRRRRHRPRDRCAGVTGFKAGDRVAWVQSQGSYARWKIDCRRAGRSRCPPEVSCEDAAATLFQGMTAHYLACSTHPLARRRDLRHPFRGRRRRTAADTDRQDARRHRDRSGVDPEKAQVANDNGADHVVVYANNDLVDIAQQVTGGRGVDVVYDAVGKDTFEQSLKCLRPRGLLALYGEASGLVPPLDVRQLLMAGSVYLTRTGLDHYALTPEERRQRGDDVLRWLADGKLKPRIDSRFALEDAAAAHRAIESRGTMGKILLAAAAAKIKEKAHGKPPAIDDRLRRLRSYPRVDGRDGQATGH